MSRSLTILITVVSFAPVQADEGKEQAFARLRSAVECERMPPSLNPWGADCSTQVAKRWIACSKANQGHAAALDDCLGFKRPPPPPILSKLKHENLRKWALDQCSALPPTVNWMGEHCKDEVSERFERCGAPAIAEELSVAALANCLGFDVPPDPPPPKTLVSCERADIRVHLSATVAHRAAWAASKPRTINGQTLYVANRAVLDERDVEKLRLEERGGERRVQIALSPAAAKRLADASAAAVGEYLLLAFDGAEVVVRVESAIPGDKLYFDPGPRGPAKLCRAH